MEWIQTLFIVGTLGSFTYWMFSKLDSDVKMLAARQDSQTQRIDQLYQMFIDLLKEGKK
jgi:hypothetical protein